MRVKVLFSLAKRYSEAALDKAYDQGLKDGDWFTSGAGTHGKVVEFVREGETAEAVLAAVAEDLAVYGIKFDRSYIMEIDGVWQNVNPKYQ